MSAAVGGRPHSRRLRRGGDRDRHPCPADLRHPVRRPRVGRGRRAAPVRGRATRCVGRQGRAPAAHPGDDRDAHPADRRDDRLRRPGDVHADRDPGRTSRRLHRRRQLRLHPDLVRRTWQRLIEEVAEGRQAFVVCPRISDRLARTRRTQGRRSRTSTASSTDGPMRDLRVAMLHGRLPAEEKDEVMGRFVAGELDVLVATTVIEVGVDVPERLGDGDLRRRPLRDLPAAPAPRPHRPRRPPRRLPAAHRRAAGLPALDRLAAVAGPGTASCWPRSIWPNGARATCSGPSSRVSVPVSAPAGARRRGPDHLRPGPGHDCLERIRS